MAIYKRNDIYWYDFWVAKKRERGSTGHVNKRKAQAFHDDLKARKKREANGLEVPIINKLTIYEALDLYLADPELIASCRASSLLTKRHVWLGGDRVNRPKKKGSLVLKDIIKDAPPAYALTHTYSRYYPDQRPARREDQHREFPDRAVESVQQVVLKEKASRV